MKCRNHVPNCGGFFDLSYLNENPEFLACKFICAVISYLKSLTITDILYLWCCMFGTGFRLIFGCWQWFYVYFIVIAERYLHMQYITLFWWMKHQYWAVLPVIHFLRGWIPITISILLSYEKFTTYFIVCESYSQPTRKGIPIFGNGWYLGHMTADSYVHLLSQSLYSEMNSVNIYEPFTYETRIWRSTCLQKLCPIIQRHLAQHEGKLPRYPALQVSKNHPVPKRGSRKRLIHWRLEEKRTHFAHDIVKYICWK